MGTHRVPIHVGNLVGQRRERVWDRRLQKVMGMQSPSPYGGGPFEFQEFGLCGGYGDPLLLLSIMFPYGGVPYKLETK